MTVSIELLLDPRSEALVREDWERLARAGHSSLAAHRAPSNRPHITLLARSELGDVTLGGAVASLPFALRLGDPVVFDHGDRVVLARAVQIDAALAALHRAVHDAVPAGEDAPWTAPGRWTPHVTLARRLRRESLDDALALLGPGRGAIAVAVRRWDAASKTVTMLGPAD